VLQDSIVALEARLDVLLGVTPSPAFNCGTSTVRFDGHDYTTAQIGSQCWFAENLRNQHYRNGDLIPSGLDVSTWQFTTSGASTIYDEGGPDASSNLAVYGRLYNWFAVSDARGLCPTGWHVPTDAEWAQLETELGGLTVAGAALKSSPSDTPAWDGLNSSGFNALPGGARSGYFSDLHGIGYQGHWWSSTWSGTGAVNRTFYSGAPEISRFLDSIPQTGFSVRCLRGELPSMTSPRVDRFYTIVVGATTASIMGTFTDGGNAVTGVGFKFGTDPALTSPTDVAADAISNPFTATLIGLIPNTPYWGVAYAVNAQGIGYSDTISFTTTAVNPAFTCGTSTVNYGGYNYTTVQIGTQCWFAENLRTANYGNGDPIPSGLDDLTWSTSISGACSVYEEGGPNESVNLATYGRLYNWYAIADPRGLCPMGWHTPKDAEWTMLENALGGYSVAGAKLKASPSDNPAWDGTNSSLFSGLPSGYRHAVGLFYSQGIGGYWWTSSPHESNAMNREINSTDSGIYRIPYELRNGFAVRCVLD
jgi:uncharacterized protein (TIGR02145 family)